MKQLTPEQKLSYYRRMVDQYRKKGRTETNAFLLASYQREVKKLATKLGVLTEFDNLRTDIPTYQKWIKGETRRLEMLCKTRDSGELNEANQKMIVVGISTVKANISQWKEICNENN